MNKYKLIKQQLIKLTAMIDELIERDNKDEIIMMQKESIAKRYNLSKSQIDKLMKTNILQEEVHYSRPSDGHPLFYVKACDNLFLPKRSQEVL